MANIGNDYYSRENVKLRNSSRKGFPYSVISEVHFESSISPKPQNFHIEYRELTSLITSFDHIFLKDKYDVGLINVEPNRRNLTYDSPVCLRPYRPSQEEIENKNKIQNLLKSSLIKESISSYSTRHTLACKQGEGKIRLCTDYGKLNALARTKAEPIPRNDKILDKLSQQK